jgi:hypothetical protein
MVPSTVGDLLRAAASPVDQVQAMQVLGALLTLYARSLEQHEQLAKRLAAEVLDLAELDATPEATSDDAPPPRGEPGRTSYVWTRRGDLSR